MKEQGTNNPGASRYNKLFEVTDTDEEEAACGLKGCGGRCSFPQQIHYIKLSCEDHELYDKINKMFSGKINKQCIVLKLNEPYSTRIVECQVAMHNQKV